MNNSLIHKHKGARNELIAICWLLDQGYEVYRNISQHGLIDLIAIRDGETLKIDVKSAASLESKIWGGRAHLEAGIIFLKVTDSGACAFEPVSLRAAKICCKLCGVEFTPSRGQIYCSTTCRNKVNAADTAKREHRHISVYKFQT